MESVKRIERTYYGKAKRVNFINLFSESKKKVSTDKNAINHANIEYFKILLDDRDDEK